MTREGTVEILVMRGRETLRHSRLRYADGVCTPCGASGDGPGDGGADLTLMLTEADAAATSTRDLDPSVAFMRGRLKAEGDFGLLIAVLSATRGGTCEALRDCASG